MAVSRTKRRRVLLILLMLLLLIGFFGLFAGLVFFAESVIEPQSTS
jgi:Tfp pilus assembly protein PilN